MRVVVLCHVLWWMSMWICMSNTSTSRPTNKNKARNHTEPNRTKETPKKKTNLQNRKRRHTIDKNISIDDDEAVMDVPPNKPLVSAISGINSFNWIWSGSIIFLFSQKQNTHKKLFLGSAQTKQMNAISMALIYILFACFKRWTGDQTVFLSVCVLRRVLFPRIIAHILHKKQIFNLANYRRNASKARLSNYI